MADENVQGVKISELEQSPRLNDADVFPFSSYLASGFETKGATLAGLRSLLYFDHAVASIQEGLEKTVSGQYFHVWRTAERLWVDEYFNRDGVAEVSLNDNGEQKSYPTPNAVIDAIKQATPTPVDSFEQGNTLTSINQALRWKSNNNAFYSWRGVYPKIVPPGSTPETTGGFSRDAWVDVTDITIRSDLNNPDGLRLIGQVNSFSELRNIEPSNAFQRISLASYYSGWAATMHGKSGGGEFYHVPASTELDDAGTCAVTASGARWVRNGRFSGLVDVHWFGAIGNNEDYTTQLQSALSFCLKNALTMYFPSGSYQISQTLLINKSGVKIQGINVDSVRIINTAPTAAISFDSQGSDYITGYGVSNLSIIGDSDKILHIGTTGHGITLRKCGNSGLLENIKIHQNQHGIFAQDSYTTNFSNIWTQWNRENGFYSQTACNNFTFVGCQFNYNGLMGVRHGGMTSSFTTCNFEGNELDQLYLTGYNHIVISGYFEKLAGNGNAAIRLVGCQGAAIHNCFITDEGHTAGIGEEILGVVVDGSSSQCSVSKGSLFRNTTGHLTAVTIYSGLDNMFELREVDRYINHSYASNRFIYAKRIPQQIGGSTRIAHGDFITHNLGVLPSGISIITLGGTVKLYSVLARTETTVQVGVYDLSGTPSTGAVNVVWSISESLSPMSLERVI